MSWKKVTLETLYDAPSRNGLYKSKEFHGSGVRIVNMGEMFAYPFIGNQNMQLLNVTDDELHRFGLQSGDLLFARRSLVEAGAGKCSLVVDHNNPMVFESSMIRVRLQKDFCNPKFYYHYFKSHVGRSTITAIITGVAQKGIRGSELAKIEVDLPPLPTQQRIADILSAYDDLIDNNNRRIALLEESIHLIYKEWFVNLRFPNCDRVKVVDGVPEGWELKKIQDFGKVVTGKTPSTEITEYHGGDVPFVKTPDMHGNIFVVEVENTLTELGSNSQKNQEISAGSIMVACIGAKSGVVSISSATCHTNQQINSLIPSQNIYIYYCYYSLINLREHLRAIGSNGATMINVNKKKFGEMPLLKPIETILKKFHGFAVPHFETILNLQKQNLLIREARDRLLPKLMNGTISV